MPGNEDPHRRSRTRVYVYQGNVPPWLALLVVVPLLLFAFSMVAALLVGGAVAGLALPLLFGRRNQDTDPGSAIELDPGEYHVVDDQARPRLPKG